MILTCDPGINNIGYTLYDEESKRIIISKELVTHSKDIQNKLVEIHDNFQPIFENYNINYFVYEKPVFKNRGETGVLMSYCLGVLILFSGLANSQILQYTPKRIKKEVTGDGNADKRDVARHVAKYFDIAENFSSNHASDSLGVLMCFLKNKNG